MFGFTSAIFIKRFHVGLFIATVPITVARLECLLIVEVNKYRNVWLY